MRSDSVEVMQPLLRQNWLITTVATYLHAKQSFKLISAFSSCLASLAAVVVPDPEATPEAVANVCTS